MSRPNNLIKKRTTLSKGGPSVEAFVASVFNPPCGDSRRELAMARYYANRMREESYTGAVRVLVENGEAKADVPLVPRLQKIKERILERRGM